MHALLRPVAALPQAVGTPAALRIDAGTLAQIDEVARAVPRAELLKLTDCGHSPHRDQPEAVTAAIADFLHRAGR